MVESPGFGGGTHARARCFLRSRPRTGSICVLPAKKHRARPMNDAPIKWGKIMAGPVAMRGPKSAPVQHRQGPQPQTARQPDLARRNEQNSDGQARSGPEMRQVIVMAKFA